MLGEQGLARQKGLEVGVQERTPKIQCPCMRDSWPPYFCFSSSSAFSSRSRQRSPVCDTDKVLQHFKRKVQPSPCFTPHSEDLRVLPFCGGNLISPHALPARKLSSTRGASWQQACQVTLHRPLCLGLGVLLLSY